MSVFITGANGQLGRSIIAELKKKIIDILHFPNLN